MTRIPWKNVAAISEADGKKKNKPHAPAYLYLILLVNMKIDKRCKKILLFPAFIVWNLW